MCEPLPPGEICSTWKSGIAQIEPSCSKNRKGMEKSEAGAIPAVSRLSGSAVLHSARSARYSRRRARRMRRDSCTFRTALECGMAFQTSSRTARAAMHSSACVRLISSMMARGTVFFRMSENAGGRATEEQMMER